MQYTYTDAGLPRQLSSPTGGAYVADTIYNSYGEMTQLTMGNTIGRSLYHTFVYEDGTHRLAQAIIDRQSSPTTDETIGYSYDPSGRPTMVHAALADGTADTQCYRYGERSQLTQAWTPANGNCGTDPTQAGLGGPAPYWQSWTHDVAGNIVSITDRTKTTSTATTLSYPTPGSAGPHFTTSAVSTGSAPGTRTFTADAAGNTTTRANTSTPTQSLTWDPEGHLAAVTTGTGPVVTIAAYLYDADGGRLVRVEGGIATLYLGGRDQRGPDRPGGVGERDAVLLACGSHGRDPHRCGEVDRDVVVRRPAEHRDAFGVEHDLGADDPADHPLWRCPRRLMGSFGRASARSGPHGIDLAWAC